MNEIIPLISESNVLPRNDASEQQIRTAKVTITPGGRSFTPEKEAKTKICQAGVEKKEGKSTGVSVKFLRTKFSH